MRAPLCIEAEALDLFWAHAATTAVPEIDCFGCLQIQDSDNLREALRHSASMLAELRTSFLTPQKYFELYMQVFDKLTYLEVSCT